MLGVAKNNPDLMIKVSEESDIFNDILVGSYEDSYKNLTLKTLSGFYWLNFHCRFVFIIEFLINKKLISQLKVNNLEF